jgi:Type I phosphodiesterase / nucleotide pyrophosphatase
VAPVVLQFVATMPLPKHKEPEIEEREGLLSGETSKNEALDDTPRGWSRKALVITSVSFIGILLCASLLPPFFGYRSGRDKGGSDKVEGEKIGFSQGETLRSNGTHDFKRTVLMVSIDGLRADYLDRGLTPHLLQISQTGLRAKWMRPIFPVSHLEYHLSLSHS